MRNWLLSILLAGVSTVAHAQTPVPTVRVVDEMLGQRAGVRYYDQYWAPLPTGPGGAHCYDRFVRVDSAGLNWQARRYVLSTGRLILEQYFTGLVPGMELEGPSREWYETGQLREELTYHKSQVVGVLQTYYPDGKPRRTEFSPPAKGTTVCLDSAGHPLPKCPPYHTFAQLSGKNTYSGKFLKSVQQQFAGYLPAGYSQPAGLLVYYAFRIDPTGTVQDARILTDAPADLQAAVLQAVRKLPKFVPAMLEGSLTNDVVEGMVEAKAVRR
ncbi:energy transducer TonB [Hymenobacter sp. BT770]|uniref:energy transducer TonB n=1 Tax=Hymenobacter sp. BT770 TaxID=2886942 RepID=UPI001D12ED30|nr:energy transducer TonB [Hymenobacter sp. BT770]MCC3155543.1 energy transducer TonB [Hymenobacter sp. BT770]MDO3417525.1 energy transducer TonB [Hymenobacter sp. BT770]